MTPFRQVAWSQARAQQADAHPPLPRRDHGLMRTRHGRLVRNGKLPIRPSILEVSCSRLGPLCVLACGLKLGVFP